MTDINDFKQLFGIEPASLALIEAVRHHGRTLLFVQTASEEERFLDYFQAEASVGGKKLYPYFGKKKYQQGCVNRRISTWDSVETGNSVEARGERC